ncbi:MAG: SagB/ThcOx family dehydrogenase, partial [Firmicutes bacterium]|nr:SagB/ThcOx family dehydrogenase [Bacillota bacterium]
MKKISLPGPKIKGSLSIEEALYNRVSRRSFGAGSLNRAQVGQLLWAAGGLGVDSAAGVSRTAPSAGATYPLELYLVVGRVEGMEAGLYHYDHRDHSLDILQKGDLRDWLAGAALGQQMIERAPASI